MKKLIVLILAVFLIVSVVSAEETSHRFHGKKVHKPYVYNYNYDKDFDFDFDHDFDFDFKHDFDHDFDHKYGHHGWDIMDDIDMEFDDGSIFFEHRYHGDVVEITEDHYLFINGDKIDLDADQRELVGDFYMNTHEIIESAKDVGIEGAKIGLKGAKLGISAIFKLFKLVSSNYDTEDYEFEMNREAELLEDHADILEEHAEDIEKLAEDLEDLAEELNDEIPELA